MQIDVKDIEAGTPVSGQEVPECVSHLVQAAGHHHTWVVGFNDTQRQSLSTNKENNNGGQ